MSRYYGVKITSADVLLENIAKLYAVSEPKVMWFTSEDAAIQYCDSQFKQKEEFRQAIPELYAYEKTTMPGAAFIWMTDTEPAVSSMVRAPHGCIGTGDAPGYQTAEFVYVPPVGFDAKQDVFGHRPYLYYIDNDNLAKMAQAYTPEGRGHLPEGYTPQLVPTDRVFVHYGSTEFDIDVFERAYTRSFDVKPESGFWASPKDSENDWDSWCKREQFHKNHPNIRCEFTIEPGAKVMHVSTLDDILFLLQNYPTQLQSGVLPWGNYMEAGLPHLMIDYEAMSKDFDGLSYDHAALGNILGPWDCDSICIFNPECMRFREIELVPVENEAQYDEFSDICTDEDWLDEEEW